MWFDSGHWKRPYFRLNLFIILEAYQIFVKLKYFFMETRRKHWQSLTFILVVLIAEKFQKSEIMSRKSCITFVDLVSKIADIWVEIVLSRYMTFYLSVVKILSISAEGSLQNKPFCIHVFLEAFMSSSVMNSNF